MMHADYTTIAGSFDVGRPLREETIELWLSLLEEFFPSEARDLLDLGCGTGRFSLPIATRFKVRVTGADNSEAMLDKAREKDTAGIVRWDSQNAERLTYPDGSFDVVFASHLLHHADAPTRVVRECHRVLRAGGVLLLRYGAIEQIVDDVEHTFFPEAIAIDKARTPTVKEVEQWLLEAGFVEVESCEVRQETHAKAADRLAAVKARSTSVLSLLPEEAFKQGVGRLTDYIEGHAGDAWLLQDRMTLTVGCRE